MQKSSVFINGYLVATPLTYQFINQPSLNIGDNKSVENHQPNTHNNICPLILGRAWESKQRSSFGWSILVSYSLLTNHSREQLFNNCRPWLSMMNYPCWHLLKSPWQWHPSCWLNAVNYHRSLLLKNHDFFTMVSGNLAVAHHSFIAGFNLSECTFSLPRYPR